MYCEVSEQAYEEENRNGSLNRRGKKHTERAEKAFQKQQKVSEMI